MDIRKKVRKFKGPPNFSHRRGGILLFWICKVIPSNSKIKERVLVEALITSYSIHLGSTNMY